MKSIVYLFLCFSLIISIYSCGGKSNNEEPTEKVDTVWNEKVQDVFFDAKFGDSIPDVVKKFGKHDFILLENISTDALLHFSSTQGRYFTFGNIGWEMLDVIAENGRFTGIRFMNASDDKASALNHYNNLKNAIGAKYKITPVETSDTTVYAKCSIFGHNESAASISCYRYETISNDIKIAIQLYYSTSKNYGVSEEL